MANITLRRSKSRKQRAVDAAEKAASVALTAVKARIAWLAGKKAAKVAAPAVAVGTAAVVVKKRSSRFEREDSPETEATNAHPVGATPAAV